MYIEGLIIGIVSFLIIGIFHPIVIKTEYYFGKKCWWIFLLAGLLFIACSLITSNLYASIVFGLLGFTCLWSIKELFEQEKRVEKGWFPSNPKKKK
jgi:hypothetical protein